MTAQLIEHFGPADVSVRGAGSRASALAIRVVWPDREHAVIGVAGAEVDPERLGELRERVQALMVGGVRYVLVDLSEAPSCGGAVLDVLADAAARLQERDGWLRVHRLVTEVPCPGSSVEEATLSELFAIYRALAGAGE
jgi:anti-anti-sigma regulatory factor